MFLPRLLLLPLLASAPLAAAQAQFSSSALPPGLSPGFRAPLAAPIPPLQFTQPAGNALPVPRTTSQFNPKLNLGQPGDLDRPPAAKQFKLSPGMLHVFDPVRQWELAQRIQRIRDRMILARSAPATCYTLRTYDFAAQAAGSDATRLAGTSTCLANSGVHLKAVAEPHLLLPR